MKREWDECFSKLLSRKIFFQLIILYFTIFPLMPEREFNLEQITTLNATYTYDLPVWLLVSCSDSFELLGEDDWNRPTLTASHFAKIKCECIHEPWWHHQVQQQWREAWSFLQFKVCSSSSSSLGFVLKKHCWLSLNVSSHRVYIISISWYTPVWVSLINTVLFAKPRSATAHCDYSAPSRSHVSHHMTQSGNNCVIVRIRYKSRTWYLIQPSTMVSGLDQNWNQM